MGSEHRAPSPGRVLGDFVLLEELASGGQGQVYLAEQPALERQAVVKILHGRDPLAPATQRFLREARLASQLDHPYAAHIYAFGAEPDGLLWIAMELVRGSSLAEWLARRGPIELARFVPLLEGICEVLSSAHERGIVHRDLKPENVMVMSRAGRLLPKLLDFGIARALDDRPRDRPADRATEPLSSEDRLAFDAAIAEGREATLKTLSGLTQRVTSGATTESGGIIGSPRYMAPEQWFAPSTAGQPADIYSLGVLAFEALTGELAFAGDTLIELATKHAKSEPPSLGPDFPPALSEVLTRAMAKRPNDRFATVLDFASAFREASGKSPVDVILPRFDETVRDAVLTAAPQPIAECLSAYQGARSFEQARLALAGLAETCLDYLLTIAICGRHQNGGLPSADAEPNVGELVRRWCGPGLLAGEKVELLAATCAPFAKMPDLFPLAELILLVSDQREVLDELARVATLEPSESPATVCKMAVASLESSLSALGFLGDYPLVVRIGDEVVLWVGPRRRRQALLAVSDPLAFAEGEPTLIDESGLPVLGLYPLGQIARPTPGEPDEIFFLNRGHHLGAVLLSRPVGYERRDDEVVAFLSVTLESAADATALGLTDRAPYRGLSTFSVGDADWFFGREKEAESFANRLRTQQFIAVVGPSGVGKSSFVRAGVLPRLGETSSIILRPGRDPVGALRAAITEQIGLGATINELETASDFSQHLESQARATTGSIVILVDQFEELVTLCPSTDERERFGKILVELGFTQSAFLRVVVTLRDDFLMRLEQIPSLRNHLGRGIQLLSTPVASDLRRILTEPAAKVGYEFDPPSLPDEMVADVEARPGALALLSFTALKLWELRDERYKRLQERSYEKMGGVGGALAQHAEQTLASLSDGQKRLVREAFRRLVTAEGTRAVLSRNELTEVLGSSADAGAVLEALISARLLSSSEGEADDRIEVVHEALLSAWPRLVRWRQADAESARLRDQLRDAARQWDERGRPQGLLWRGEALTEYTLWRARYEGMLTRREDDFAGASIREATRGRRIRRLALVSAAVILLGASLTLSLLYRESQQQRRVAVAAEEAAEASSTTARERFVELLVEQGRIAALDKRPLAALAYAEAAHRSGGRGTTIDYLTTSALRNVAAQLASYSGHIARVTSVAATSDGELILGASWSDTNPEVIVWDGASTREVHRFAEHRRGVHGLLLAPNQRVVLTFDRGDEAFLWQLGGGRTLAQFPSILAADFRADGDRLVLAGARGVITVELDTLARTEISRRSATAIRFRGDDLIVAWQGGSVARITPAGVARWTTPPIFDGTLSIEVSGDRAVVYELGAVSAPVVLDLKSGRVVGRFEGWSGALSHLDVSEPGRRVAASVGSQVGLWTLAGGFERMLEGDGDVIESIAFSPTGDQLAVGTAGRTIRLHSTADGKIENLLHGHTDLITTVAFLAVDEAGRSQVISGANDLTVKRWTTARLGRVEVAAGITAMFPTTDGQPIALRGRELVRLKMAGDRIELESLSTLADEVVPYSVFDELRGNVSDGGIAAITTRGGPVAVALSSGKVVGACAGATPLATAAAISPDGRFLAGAVRAGPVLLCDRETGRAIELAGAPVKAGLGLSFDASSELLTVAGPEVVQWNTMGLRQPVIDAPKTTSWSAYPLGDELIVATIDGSIRVWRDNRVIKEYRSDQYLVASAIVGDLVVGLDRRSGATLIWDRETTKLVGGLDGEGYADVLVIDPSGQALIHYDNGRVVRLDIRIERGDLDGLSRAVECELPYRVVDGELTVVSAKRGRCD